MHDVEAAAVGWVLQDTILIRDSESTGLVRFRLTVSAERVIHSPSHPVVTAAISLFIELSRPAP